jgi:hypothetical protein
MKNLFLFPLLVLMAGSIARAETAANSLLTNGDMEAGGLGTANGWPTGKGISTVEEEGNHFLRLQADEPGLQIQAHRIIKLPGGVQKLNVSFRVRFAEITPGTQSWHRGSVIMHFKDASGQMLKPDPAPFAFKGNSNGWVEKTVQLDVPEGATTLEFMPALFQVAQGTLDIDDVAVVPE